MAVSLDVRSQSEMLKAVLIDHDFDIYVGLHPADYDPDFLYETLHSTYANEAGWQNLRAHQYGVRHATGATTPLRATSGSETSNRS